MTLASCSASPLGRAGALLFAALALGCQVKNEALTDANLGTSDACVGDFADMATGGTIGGSPAIGPPDGMTVGIGPNDTLILLFSNGVPETVMHNDFHFVATSAGDSMAAVYVSSDYNASPGSFIFSGQIGYNTTSMQAAWDIDMATALARVTYYVKIVGLQGRIDLDAVQAIWEKASCGPNPDL